uniref:Uncharacterized protein n=1 Tax=Anopheles dirus TaxID=7168 RepID=A0A182NR39_9DIPT
MDVESGSQVCDTRVILSQSAVSQKSIDLDISLRSTVEDSDTTGSGTVTTSALTSSKQPPHGCSSPTAASVPSTSVTTTVVAVAPTSCTATTAHNQNAIDTDLAKRSMKLNLVDSTSSSNIRGNNNIPIGSTNEPSSSTSASASASASTTQSTSTSVVTTTTAIIMKHRKLKERTFSDEIGSPKSPAATSEVVDDRKALRDALYQGIFHRHRRTIFAVGSFLRMLKSRNSSYNTIRSSSEGEDDTK